MCRRQLAQMSDKAIVYQLGREVGGYEREEIEREAGRRRPGDRALARTAAVIPLSPVTRMRSVRAAGRSRIGAARRALRPRCGPRSRFVWQPPPRHAPGIWVG